MIKETNLRHYLLRVVRRPWPWILRYFLAFLPALAIALLLMQSLHEWFRLPLVVQALETRSIDLFLEAAQSHPITEVVDNLSLFFGLLAIPLGWVVLRLLGLWLEGAVLTTYAADEPPTPRAFLKAGFRWLGSFLLIELLVTVGMIIILIMAILMALLVQQIWPSLMTVVGVLGGVLVLLMLIFGELMRAGAVAQDDRHVFRAIRHAGTLLRRKSAPQRKGPWALLALIVGTLLGLFLLLMAQRALNRAIPLSWWAATLIVQQVIQIAITGVGLLRRAGEVGLAVRARDWNH